MSAEVSHSTLCGRAVFYGLVKPLLTLDSGMDEQVVAKAALFRWPK
ncbi:hypothetical protein ACH50O_00750 [Methylomonas sp. 2BW1-5-20]